jgi:hypothetical protein
MFNQFAKYEDGFRTFGDDNGQHAIDEHLAKHILRYLGLEQ